MKKAFLFDIDGTIIDSSDFVFTAVEYTLREHKLSVSEEKLRRALGKSLVEFYKFLFPDKDYKLFTKTHHDFQQDKFYLGKTFKGVKKTLKKLKSEGFLLAAISNRARESLIKSLKVSKIFDYFDVIISADDIENPKPHKDHPLKALKILKVESKNAMIVGDTENDILAGKNAGIKTVGVTYGWIGKEIKNHNPDFVIDNISELLKIINLL